ncbi:MAG: PAS domain S-box protein [Solidesulfovibrio sp.]
MPIAPNTNHQGSLVSLKPFRVAAIYALLGLVWIFFSDRLADALFRQNPVLLLEISSYKGVAFVLATALLLYILLKRHVGAYVRKEQELRESQESYRLVVENAPDAIVIHDGTRILFANTAAATLLGAPSPEHLLDRRLLDFVHEQSKDSVLGRIRANISKNTPTPLREQHYLRFDGMPIDVEVAAIPFTMGRVDAALVFLRDIGQRKSAERNLRESEVKYRLLADNAQDVIFTLDPDMRLTYVSPSVQKMRGVSVEEALRETFEQSMVPDSAAKAWEAAKRNAPGQGVDKNLVERMELEMRCKDGSTLWVESVIRPIFDAMDHFLGFVGVSRDISERRRIEEDRERTQQFLSLILDAIPDPVFVKDSAHRFVMANNALGVMLGHNPSAIIGKRDQDFVPKDEADVFVVRDDLVLKTGREDLFEEHLTDSQGAVHTLVTRKGLFVDPRGARYIVGVIRDVTRDKVNEQRLRESLLEKEVLLKEVHHRVKNNLQVISSLLFLQKDNVEDPAIQDMFEESRNRIASMALVHEELYRSGDLARVDLKEYLERLAPKVVQSLRGNKSIGFALNLTECRVSVDKAIPFGLIINELMTNAVKHGFCGRDTGNVRVTVDRQEGMAQAVVEDDGIGLPEGFHPDAVKTLGMQLVVQLTRQLRGSLTFGSGARGSVFRLTFSVEESAATPS